MLTSMISDYNDVLFPNLNSYALKLSPPLVPSPD